MALHNPREGAGVQRVNDILTQDNESQKATSPSNKKHTKKRSTPPIIIEKRLTRSHSHSQASGGAPQEILSVAYATINTVKDADDYNGLQVAVEEDLTKESVAS